MDVSIVLPVYNERAQRLDRVVSDIRAVLKQQTDAFEIILVDDGSETPLSASFADNAGGALRVIRHPYNMGNGAAIKTGARAAQGKVLVFMDADGQHNPSDIPRLLDKIREGYDMAVGARRSNSQASAGRTVANGLYNRLGSWMVGHQIMDLTSGFRAARAEKLREFIYLFPNGFSYPTTVTMAFFRAGYAVAYIPILAAKREGSSHIRPIKDGIRFLLIIFRVGTLYSPLKLFAPVSLAYFLMGLAYYGYTYYTQHRFTNMSALLLTTSLVIFLIGLVSEQVTNLLYSQKRD